MTTTDKYNQYLMMPHKYLPISYAQFYARTKKGMTIEEIINTKGLKDLTKENNTLYKEYKSKVKKPYKRASFLVLLDLGNTLQAIIDATNSGKPIPRKEPRGIKQRQAVPQAETFTVQELLDMVDKRKSQGLPCMQVIIDGEVKYLPFGSIDTKRDRDKQRKLDILKQHYEQKEIQTVCN